MISRKVLFILFGLLMVFVTVCSVWGLLTPDFYFRETRNWQAQSVGQDMIDLMLVVPALLVTTVVSALNTKTGLLLWAGVLLYLVYTFAIYCFAVHFNSLFAVYCLILGLAFYSFLTVMYHYVIWQNAIPVLEHVGLIRTIGMYFIAISVLFSLLWLSEIIPSLLSGNIPVSLGEVGLFTNPVHVIDLAIFLPGVFIAGVLILNRRPIGFMFIPVLLVFFMLMNLTIASVVIVMKQRGLEADLSVAAGMCVLAVFSLAVLIYYQKRVMWVAVKFVKDEQA